jgi:hypothetical protein
MKAPKYDDKAVKGLFENKPSAFQIDEKLAKKAAKKNEDAFKEKKDELLKPYTEDFTTDITDEIEHLFEIKEQMSELLFEAEQIIRQAANDVGDRIIYQRAKSYWLAHIATALSKESEYLGGSMSTFEDTIEELEEAAAGGPDADDMDDEEIEMNRRLRDERLSDEDREEKM